MKSFAVSKQSQLTERILQHTDTDETLVEMVGIQ